jgi:RES domain-containing protein
VSLIRRLQRLASLASVFKSKAFRSATPRYAKATDLLTGDGSRKFGGRWNPRGLAAIYASLTPETAMAETLAHARYYGLSEHDVMPRTFVAISFDLKRVLDLTDGDIRRKLSVSRKRMIEIDWRTEMYAGNFPLTQQLGQAAANIGLEGLLVPSAAEPSGRGIVAFPQNYETASAVVVLAPGKL